MIEHHVLKNRSLLTYSAHGSAHAEFFAELAYKVRLSDVISDTKRRNEEQLQLYPKVEIHNADLFQ